MALCIPPHLLRTQENSQELPSSSDIYSYALEQENDFLSREKEKVKKILQMPEEERARFLCQKKSYMKCINSDDFPFEYQRVITSEIDWFDPEFRMQLLESLSSKNIVKVLNRRIGKKTVYANLPPKCQKDILTKLSEVQQRTVLNPPSVISSIARFCGLRK